MQVCILKETDNTYSVITIQEGVKIVDGGINVVFNGNFCFAHTIRFAFVIAGYTDTTDEAVSPPWFKGM